MANSGLSIVFPVTAVFDLQSSDKAAAELNAWLGKSMQSFNLNMKSLRSGENLTDTMLGGGDKFQSLVDASLTGMGKIKTSWINLTAEIGKGDEKRTQSFRMQTNQLVELEGLMGTSAKFQKEFATEESIRQKLAAEGYENVVVGVKEELQANIASAEAIELKTKEQTKFLDDYEEMAAKVDEQIKGKSGKQVEAIRTANNAFKEEITHVRELGKESKATGKDLEVLAEKGQEVGVKLKGISVGANSIQEWGNRLGAAIKQTIAYTFSIGLMYKAQRLLNDAIRYTVDLNTEMVKIQVLQVEGAKTDTEINALARSYNNLGREMGASTLEIAKGSVEWLRQGRTTAETMELMKSSMMLAKLGAMDSADATNYLTSITNAFKISTEEASSVVDKLIAVDNIAATSAGELATAMRYTSESAALAGVSMEQLISYIGVVSTVTRQNAEMIGQAFKTMFSRMTLMEGGGKDEEGWTISKVEKALGKVGIEVRNADDSLMAMGNILEQTASKWDTFTDREKTSIATAIAGVRQREAFLVLMDNMGKALEYQTAQTTSSGLAMDRYGIYLESVEAKQAKLKATTEAFYMNVLNSDTIKKVYDLAIGIVELGAATETLTPLLITLGGILGTIFGVQILGGIKAYIGQFITLKKVVDTATKAVWAFNAANLPLLLITGGIALIGAAWTMVANEEKKAREEQEKLVEAGKEYIDVLKQLPQNAETVEELFIKIKDLQSKKSLQGGNLSEEDQKDLDNYTAKLHELFSTYDGWMYGERGVATIDLLSVSLDKFMEQFIMLNKLTNEGTTSIDAYFTTLVENFQDITASGKAMELGRQLGDAISSSDWEAFRSLGNQLYETILTIPDEQRTQWEKDMFAEFMDPTGVEDAITGYWYQVKDLDFHESKVFLNERRDEFIAQIPEAFNNEALRNKSKNEIKQFLADIFTLPEDTKNSIIDILMLQLSSDPELMAIFGEAWDEFITASNQTPNDPSKIVDINVMLEQQLTIIDKLTSGWNEYINAKTKSEKLIGLKKLVETTNDLIEANGLVMDSLEWTDYLDEKGNFQTQELLNDLYAIRNSINTTGEAWGENGQIGEAALNDWITKLEETTGLVEHNGKMVLLEGQQVETFIDKASSAIWDATQTAQNAITLALNNNTNLTITSADQIKWALQEGYISFTDLILQATEYAAINGLDLAEYLKELIDSIINSTSIPTYSSPRASGGGGGGKSDEDKAEEERLQKKIDKLEEQKEKYQEMLDEYNDWIEAQKESLKRQKEESDYLDKLADKYKSLSKIKAKLALIEGDDSEEAQRLRIELEEEAAEQAEEIKEDEEDRKYDLMIQALEDAQEAYQTYIDELIVGIDEMIEELTTALEELGKSIESSGGTGFGGMSDDAESMEETVLKVYKAIMEDNGDYLDDLGLSADAIYKLAEKWVGVKGTMEEAIQKVQEYIDKLKQAKLVEQGGCFVAGTKISMANGDYKNIEDLIIGEMVLSYDLDNKKIIHTEISKTTKHINIKENLYWINGFLGITGEHPVYINEKWVPIKEAKIGDVLYLETGENIKIETIEKNTGKFTVYNLHIDNEAHNYFANKILVHNKYSEGHTGGIVRHKGGPAIDTNHGNFAGGLYANEIFATLLKGEYIATEGQMNNFVKNILPKISGVMAREYELKDKSSSNGNGDTNFDMSIVVNGSLDKSVLPELKKSIMKEINKSLDNRGIKRSATSFSV